MKYLYKKSVFVIVFLLVIISSSFAQNQKSQNYPIVEKRAEPKSGMSGFYKYVAGEMIYPKEAYEKQIEGQVYVKFLIDEFGKIDDESIEIEKSDHKLFEEEAKRIISVAPDWIPAEQSGGVKVKQRMIVPIIFNIKGYKKILKKRQKSGD